MYTPNNILFRIVSSSAIAQYKLDQAFDFNELVNNKEYSFSQESRETLLLNYELWFKFIIRLEKIFIRDNDALKSIEHLVNPLIISVGEVIDELTDVIQCHPVIFNSYSKGLVRKAHEFFTTSLARLIEKCKDDNMYIAFPKIVSAISLNLHNLLLILHEIEHLINGSEAFLSYTDTVAEICKETTVCPLLERAKLYKSSFGVDSFTIKNYTNKSIPQQCIDRFVENRFNVIDIDVID